MLRFDEADRRLNVRSVAIIIENDCVLIHREADDDFWALPGGRVEFFETSEQTVVREIEEELGRQASVGELRFYVENFFEFKGIRYHEISTYFPVTLHSPPVVEPGAEFRGIEPGTEFVFKWVRLSDLEPFNVKPAFLKEKLNQPSGRTEYLKVSEL